MFLPNTTAQFYQRLSTTDNFGKHRFAAPVTIKCSIIYMNDQTKKTSVRKDTSASRGQAEELVGVSRFLVPKYQTLKIGDVLFKDGVWLEVTEFTPRRNVLGAVDHNQVDLRKREAVTANGA